MLRSVDNTPFSDAKKAAYEEAQLRCRGKPDRVRHQTFIRLWERRLKKIVTEVA